MNTNCFDFKKLSSDYLDGTLVAIQMKDADLHLDECADCKQHTQRMRILLKTISSQSRTPLPLSILKSPLAFVIPKFGPGLKSSQWERTPWYVRTSVEGLAITFSLVLLVALIPRLRTIYERSLERNINLFSLADLYPGSRTGNEPIPQAARGRPALGPQINPTEDEFASEGDSEDSVTADDEPTLITDDPDVRVGNSEIWRFNVRTDSPKSLQPKIVQLLTAHSQSSDLMGIAGVEAPGGIQFDLTIPKTAIAPLKKQLQKLAHLGDAAEDSVVAPTKTAQTNAFTWYKTKSKKAITTGKARIVIWLSQN